MSRVCTICKHPERATIDKQVVAGVSYRAIAQHHAVGYTAVQRHASSHISQAIKRQKEARDAAATIDVVAQLIDLNTLTWHIINESKEAGNSGLALFAIDRVLKQIELQAKLLGTINDTHYVVVSNLPEWHCIRETILQALAPYTEAKIAVAAALASLEPTN